MHGHEYLAKLAVIFGLTQNNGAETADNGLQKLCSHGGE